MAESFQPRSHYSDNKFLNWILFAIRFCLDFQFRTVYLSLKSSLSVVDGKVVDVGCGDSPFKHLLGPMAQYTGLDYNQSTDFKYNRTDIVYFDGKTFPFKNESFNFVLCTEVLEHIPEPQLFIDEIFRILNADGKAILTVPWSARFHYIPYDYFRYTPSALEILFKQFKKIDIKSRGTDLTVITSKTIVFFMGLVMSLTKFKNGFFKSILNTIFKILLVLITFPFFIIAVIAGNFSLLFKIGSSDDCLGYTIILEK
jgi:SAM-dependent methyltransferase